MIIKDFTKPEIDFFWDNCNFIGDEIYLFEARCRGVPLERIAEDLNISVTHAGRISQRVNKKIKRVQ